MRNSSHPLRMTILEGVAGAGGREFGDGGDEAVGFVEDGVFDEVGLGGGVLWNPHLRGEMLTPASKLAGDPEMWGTRGGAGFAGQEEGDDAKAGDEAAGAGMIEVVGGDAAEDERGGEQGGDAVLDEREGEGLGGVGVAELAGAGCGAATGVMVEAEVPLAEGGRATAVPVGEDVAAATAKADSSATLRNDKPMLLR